MSDRTETDSDASAEPQQGGTNAQKCKTYRTAIKTDPERYEDQKRKDNARSYKNYHRPRSEEELEQRKKDSRLRSKAYRERKKAEQTGSSAARPKAQTRLEPAEQREAWRQQKRTQRQRQREKCQQAHRVNQGQTPRGRTTASHTVTRPHSPDAGSCSMDAHPPLPDDASQDTHPALGGGQANDGMQTSSATPPEPAATTRSSSAGGQHGDVEDDNSTEPNRPQTAPRATGGELSASPSLTACRGCGSLCLGPVILPCGHVLCRRCLHDVLLQQGHGAACQQCGQCLDLPNDQGLIVSQIAWRMGTDPVVEDLVNQQLKNNVDVQCLNCPNNQAVNVCLDCQEYYCAFCSASHCRSRLGKDHVLLPLPGSLQRVPPVAPAPPRPSSSSVSSTSSLLNILDDLQAHESGGLKEWEEWVRKEAGLLEQSSHEHQAVTTTLQDIVSRAQQLLEAIHTHRQVLDTYQRHLPLVAVRQGTDPSTYVGRSDASGAVRTQSLEARLRDVRKCGQCPDLTVEQIRTEFSQLVPCADQGARATTSSTSPRAATTSITHHPSSSHHPPPSHPDSPTHHPSSCDLPPPSHPAAPTFTPSVDLVQTTPQQVFEVSARSADDKKTPCITDITCLPDDRLVMVDSDNRKVKVMGMAPPHTLSASLHLSEAPLCLAVLPDGVVAVTTWQPVIYLLTVTDRVTVSSRVNTVRQYRGVGGCSDGRLIVSCVRSATCPAAVDILTRQGQVVRTVTDSTRTDLVTPRYICTVDNRSVLVSDLMKDVVHKIDINTGQVTDRYQYEDIDGPCGVCVDNGGNVFVASMWGRCVCVRDRGGQWGTLPASVLHSERGDVVPCSVCVTGSGWLVVAMDINYIGCVNDSVVAAYRWS